MGKEKLLIGILFVLLTIVQCDTSREIEPDDYDHSKVRNVERVVVCKDKSTPCSCYPNKFLLDCHFDEDKQSDSKRLRTSAIKTPKSDFRPLKVDLSGNYLHTFDQTQFLTLEQRKEIEFLDLSNTNLELTARDVFDSFENLKMLNLSNNKIKLHRSYYYRRYEYDQNNRDEPYEWLSERLGKTLELLDLSNNNINKLPDRVLSRLINLKTLILDGNKISYLNNDYLNMPSLEILSMQGCAIDSITGRFFSSFPNLKKLVMRNNYISSFPLLDNMPKLTYVDLTNTQISNIYIPRSRLYPLETLLLGENNNMGYIGYKTFVVFPNLTKLDLHENRQLSTFDETAFGFYNFGDQQIKLQELDLSDCAITTLDENMLPWKQLKSLKIKGNRFECDTRLSWLINDRNLPIEKGTDQPRCYFPEALQGRKFVDVKQEELNNPTETAALYYAKKALDVLTKNQQLFFFSLGAISAALLVIGLKCCCCCIRCLCCSPLKKHCIRMEKRMDRFRLLEHQSNNQHVVNEYKPQEDTQTIAETIPDEE